jgi:DNA (cytosine-5)-methyltransferase 1
LCLRAALSAATHIVVVVRSLSDPGSSAASRRPTAVDLFSGAGGLSLGAEQAGMDVLAAVEYDPLCAAVHQFNFPRTEIVCGDVAGLTASAIRAAAAKGWKAHGYRHDWNQKIDVVVGGPPCQGFSLIGKRAFDDPRNQLVFSFARLVGGLKPRYFIMENVPGLASVRAGARDDSPRLLDLLVEEFSSFGYKLLESKVLNAYNFGVPQDRRRLILIGLRHGETPPSYPKLQTRGRTRQGQVIAATPGVDAGLPLCPTVHEAIGDLPNLDDFPVSAYSDEISLTEQYKTRQARSVSPYAARLRGSQRDTGNLSYRRVWDRAIMTSAYRTTHAPHVVTRFETTTQGRPEPVSRFFRLHRDAVSPTLRAGTHYDRGSFNAPRPIHPDFGRVISVREAARLHSYPDWFRFHWTKWHGFREVGNSLPPRLARAVAAEIVSALGLRPGRPTKSLRLGDQELLYLENLAAAERFDADLTRIPRNELRTRNKDIGLAS